jgi:pyrimidine-nucleoside phosphorylase
MYQPLGRAVVNSLEFREAIDTLKGTGPPDFSELVLGASGHVLALSDLGVDPAEGRRRAEQAVESGAALAAYERWVTAQGGDPDPEVLPSAPFVQSVAALESGFVQAISTEALGRAALHLGAGRSAKDDLIDHAVGVVCHAVRGDRVERGDVLAEVHAPDEVSAARGASDVGACYHLGAEAPQAKPIVLDVLS